MSKILKLFVQENDDPSMEMVNRAYTYTPSDVEIQILNAESHQADMEEFGLSTVPSAVLMCAETKEVLATHAALSEMQELVYECVDQVVEDVDAIGQTEEEEVE